MSFTSGVATSTAPLPQAYVAPQPAPAAEISDPETQLAVASILPMMDLANPATLPQTTFLDSPVESPAALVVEGGSTTRDFVAELYHPHV